MAQYLNNPSMSELRYKHLRFLITDSPADENLQSFIEVYIKLNEFKDFIVFVGLFEIWCYNISSCLRKNL